VPRTREALEALPGVGRKTANVILNVAFGEPTIAVDTHIFRVCNRTSLAPGKTPLEVERKLLERVPEKYLQHAHHWLVLLGRYVCQARKPRCWECKVARWCDYAPEAAGAAAPSAVKALRQGAAAIFAIVPHPPAAMSAWHAAHAKIAAHWRIRCQPCWKSDFGIPAARPHLGKQALQATSHIQDFRKNHPWTQNASTRSATP